MYRLLEVGEVMENGDWIFSRDDDWFKVTLPTGSVVRVTTRPVRRLVKPALTPDSASVKPATVVSVGDRVKVLSGPWAGCTGVVIGFEVELFNSAVKPKVTALKESVHVVRLDHVHVGGQRLGLTLAAIDLEKLPPVVPEVLYRDLSHGETIRHGDEFLNGLGLWRPVIAIGEKWNDDYFRPMRRPVRIQSPGWRYLDAGETVQAGDETLFSQSEPHWRDARGYSSFGYPVNSGHEKLFRRKLPANQGG